MIDPPHKFGAKTLTQKWESIMHRTLDTATYPRKRERWRHIIDPSSMNKLTANWLCNTPNMSIAPPRPTALALVSSRASASVIRPHKSWRWQLMPSTTQQHTKLNRQRINSRRAVKCNNQLLLGRQRFFCCYGWCRVYGRSWGVVAGLAVEEERSFLLIAHARDRDTVHR